MQNHSTDQLNIEGDDYLYFGDYNTRGTTNTLINAAGGVLNLSSTYVNVMRGDWGVAAFNNLGTLNQVSGGHAITGTVGFNNSGTVNVQAAYLQTQTGGTDTGVYDVASGALLYFSGGTRNLGAGTNVTGAGTFVVSAGAVSINNLFDIAKTGTSLTVLGGSLSINDTSNVSGTLVPVTINGGYLYFNTTGAITLPSLTMNGGELGGTAAMTVTGAWSVLDTIDWISLREKFCARQMHAG